MLAGAERTIRAMPDRTLGLLTTAAAVLGLLTIPSLPLDARPIAFMLYWAMLMLGLDRLSRYPEDE